MLHRTVQKRRDTWSQRLGPTGVEELLRAETIQRRVRPVAIFGGVLLAVGAGVPNIPVLCGAIVLVVGCLYVLLGPVQRAQHRAQEAAAEFQGIDTFLAFMLTLQTPAKFDSQCGRARLVDENRRRQAARRT